MFVFLLTYMIPVGSLDKQKPKIANQKSLMGNQLEPDPLTAFFKSLGLDAIESKIVENILREEVFHSTLDWQTKKELLDGAQQAHDLFRQDEAFYRASFRHSQASYRLMVAENPCTGTVPTTELEIARQEEGAARRDLERFFSQTKKRGLRRPERPVPGLCW